MVAASTSLGMSRQIHRDACPRVPWVRRIASSPRHLQGEFELGKQKNEETLRRFMTEIWSKGDMDVIDETIDPHFNFILAFAKFDTTDAFKKLVINNRTVFEGLTYVPNDVVADETKGAVWWTMTSKHVGAWRHVPGSNKDVRIEELK